MLMKQASLWVFSLVLLTQVSFAENYCCNYEQVTLSDAALDLKPGSKWSFSLPNGWRQVQKVYVSATAFYGDANLQINVNGDEKRRVHVPGTNDTYYYEANVNETTGAIELRNYYGHGTIRINSLRADLSVQQIAPIAPITPHPVQPNPDIPFPAYNEAASFARHGIDLVSALRPYADPETEYITFLLPIKRVAARALALANANGNGSAKVRPALEALIAQIQFADEYIQTTLKKDIPFELAVELLSLKDKIRRWLD